MRQEEQQVSNDHPEAVRSAPVPVPPAGDRADRSDVPEDALDDRGTFDERGTDDQPPSTSRADDTDRDAAYDPADDERADDSDPRHRRDDRSTDEGGFHEPGPLPTTFGATTVADAVAASALASPHPQDQPDPRAERTAQPGDGAEDGEREGLRADPTAELHRRDADVDEARRRRPSTTAPTWTTADADTSARTVVPPGSTDGAPERRGDLTGDPDVDGAGYGSATPEMVDPDADGEPVTADGTSTSLASAGTSPTRRVDGRGRGGHAPRHGHRAGLPGPLAGRAAALRRRSAGGGRRGAVAGGGGHPGPLLGAGRAEEHAGRVAGRRLGRHRATADGGPQLPGLPGPRTGSLSHPDTLAPRPMAGAPLRADRRSLSDRPTGPEHGGSTSGSETARPG